MSKKKKKSDALPVDDGETMEMVGRKLRALRKANGLSLAEVAARTGFSIGFLSQVERDMSKLSVKALFDLSRALGVNITYFFNNGDDTPLPPEPVIHPAARKKIFYGQGICDELASPPTCPDLSLLWSRFPPGASSGEQPYQHNGQEAGIVIVGTFELILGDETYRLEAGDSFGFESTTPHRYNNPGQIETIVVWAITPPSY